jgi:hypothetical protein
VQFYCTKSLLTFTDRAVVLRRKSEYLAEEFDLCNQVAQIARGRTQQASRPLGAVDLDVGNLGPPGAGDMSLALFDF